MMRTTVALALGLLLLATLARAQTQVVDPQGDTLGATDPQLDVFLYSGCYEEERSLDLSVALYTQISAPNSRQPNAIVGYVDLDTDENPATGIASHVDTLTPYASGLGVDYYVDLSGFDGSPFVGSAPVYDAAGVHVGDADVFLAAADHASFGIRIPLAALGGDDGIVRTAAVFGTPAGWTDAVPNGGSIEPQRCVDDSGYLPPDVATYRCERTAGRAAAKLIAGLLACHSAYAHAHVAGRSFDEDGCEDAVRARHARRLAALEGCPVCLTDGGDTLRNVMEGQIDFLAPTPFCWGGTPFGGDDGGFLPDDKDTLRCVTALARQAGKFSGGVYACHARRARAAVLGEEFDEERCERDLRGRYLAAVARLEGCPSCVLGNAPFIADTMERAVDFYNLYVYCAGTVPFESP